VTPFATTQRSFFAFCFYMGNQRRLAQEAFQAMGPFVGDEPWDYLGDPLRVVERARASVFG